MPMTETTELPEYVRIKRRLIAEIRSGRWQVGATIPSEHQLIARYKVSRATVVRSLTDLVHEGYLYRQKGKGTFVADFEAKQRRAAAIPLFIYEGTYKLSGSARQVLLRIMNGLDAGLGPTHPGINIRQLPGTSLDDETRRMIDQIKPAVALLIEPSFNPELIDTLQKQGCSVWAINEPVDACNCIYTDQEKAGYLATKFLLDRGRRRVALLNGPVAAYWGFAARLRGYRRALEEAGAAFAPELAREGANPIDSEAGRAMLREVVEAGHRVDGVVGVSDSKAMGAQAYALEAGFRVPDDLLFVSIDNTIADQAAPPLSSVELPFEELGRQAAARALEAEQRQARGEAVPVQHICLQPRLVLRGT